MDDMPYIKNEKIFSKKFTYLKAKMSKIKFSMFNKLNKPNNSKELSIKILLIAVVVLSLIINFLLLTIVLPRFIRVEMPNVENLNQDQAMQIILDKNLSCEEIIEQYSDTIPKGNIIYSSPQAGEKIKKGSSVQLVVSLGVEQVTVPNLINLSEQSALTIISDNNLNCGDIIYEYSDTTDKGFVISSKPPSRTKVSKNTTVDLYISKGANKEENQLKSEILGYWLCCSDFDDLTERAHAMALEFRKDGTYYAQTWRSKYVGTYSIVNDNIEVNCDFYFNPAGTTEYGLESHEYFRYKFTLKNTTDALHFYPYLIDDCGKEFHKTLEFSYPLD